MGLALLYVQRNKGGLTMTVGICHGKIKIIFFDIDDTYEIQKDWAIPSTIPTVFQTITL